MATLGIVHGQTDEQDDDICFILPHICHEYGMETRSDTLSCC